MKILPLSLISFAFYLSSLSATAQTLEQASDALCEHMKQCIITGMEGEEISHEMKQMMKPMLDGICSSMRADFELTGLSETSHKLYQPAKQCMASMTKLSCQEIENMGSKNTAECDEYERLSKQ